MIRREREALYMIGIAARLAGMHPQTLRIYERKKLIQPERSDGSTRLYSEVDIEKLVLIKKLTHSGLNLAGVKLVIDLRNEVEELEDEISEMEDRFLEAKKEMEERIERVRKNYKHELVLIPRGKLAKK